MLHGHNASYIFQAAIRNLDCYCCCNASHFVELPFIKLPNVSFGIIRRTTIPEEKECNKDAMTTYSPNRPLTDLLGRNPTLASQETFMRIVAGSPVPDSRNFTMDKASKPLFERASYSQADLLPRPLAPSRANRTKTYDLSKSLPPLPIGDDDDSTVIAEAIRVKDSLDDEFEALESSIHSNLDDAKDGALARVSLAHHKDVDQSVANYCKGLHSEHSPIAALDPRGHSFDGDYVEAAAVLEAVATSFLTLTLRGIFDFTKDDIDPRVQGDVLGFAIERIGLLLTDEEALGDLETESEYTASSMEERISKRKSYEEWVMEQQRKANNGRRGLVEYLEDILDEVIADIVSYFGTAMLTCYNHGAEKPKWDPQSQKSTLQEFEPLSNDSPLDKVQNLTAEALLPALREVRVGRSSVPIENLALFRGIGRGQGRQVRNSPIKKPQIVSTGNHISQAALIHTGKDNPKASQYHGHNVIAPTKNPGASPATKAAYQHAYPRRNLSPSPFFQARSAADSAKAPRKNRKASEVPKRPLLSRAYAAPLADEAPHHRSFSDLPLLHPQPVGIMRPRRHTFIPANRDHDTLSITHFPDWHEAVRRVHEEVHPGSPNAHHDSPRVENMRERLPRLSTDAYTAVEGDILDEYLDSDNTSSSSTIIAIPDTPKAGANQQGADDDEDIWLQALDNAEDGAISSLEGSPLGIDAKGQVIKVKPRTDELWF